MSGADPMSPAPADPPRRGRAGLPQVDAVLRDPAAAAAAAAHGRAELTRAVRRRLADLRAALDDADAAPAPSAVLADAVAELEAAARGRIRRVVNATGVILHTNLGRAPLSPDARRAVLAATGYSNVELDLATGARGSRTARVATLAARLTGAEAAHAVNNGAAALLLAVSALGAGREVVVSRGELVEIGGSFRLPEIVAAAGAVLREVGTTNRTRLADYAAAIGPATGLVLKVHPANFRMVGFTEDVAVRDLAELARAHDVPCVLDAGSGLVGRPDHPALVDEPDVRAAVADGAGLVLFSGDKLLGGPQAGLLVGTTDLVARCRTAPIARALRIEKLQLAGLEATLESHLRAEPALDLPAVAMRELDVAGLAARAAALAARVAAGLGAGAVRVEPTPLDGAVGGGSAAAMPLPSHGLVVHGPDPDVLAARLRAASPPVVGRIVDGRVVLDLRTVAVDEEDDLVEVLVGAVAAA